MNVAVYLSCLLLLFSCSTRKSENRAPAVDSAQAPVTATPHPTTRASPSTAKPGAVADAGKWVYENRVDEDGRTVHKASTRAPLRLEFGFPYTGGSTVTLTIRKRVGSDTHVYIQISNGQFNRSFQGGKARIRFDGGPPKLYSFSAAENGSANVIFFDQTQALIQKIKATQTLSVDVEFAGQDTRQIYFRTAGLRWTY